MSKVIAVDIGTAKFRQAVEVDGHIVILPNAQDKRATSTCVSYKNGELHVGKVDGDPRRNVCGAKRFVGRDNEQLSLFHRLASFPQQRCREESHDDREAPLFKLGIREDYSVLGSHEALAHVLDKARCNAEAKLGVAVNDAVATVPSFFGQAQRQAVVHSGRIAGLNIVRLVNESTAVAVAFASTLGSDRERTVFVLDIGASKIDLCLSHVKKGSVTVQANSGTEECSGDEFTHRLVEYVAKDIETSYGEDVRSSAKTMKRIAEACTKAKETLSCTSSCRIEIEDISDDVEEYQSEVSQELFEKLCSDLIDIVTSHALELLAKCHVDPSTVDDILLVGGPSRIPAIQSAVSEIFVGKWLNTTLNVDEAVVTGAAYLAASMCESSVMFGQMALVDALSYVITIETSGQVHSVFEKGASLPVRRAFKVSPSKCSEIIIKINELTSGVSQPIGPYFIRGAENSATVDQFNFEITVDESGLVNASMGKLCDDASLAISQKFSLVAPSEDLSVKVHDGKLWKVDGRLVVPASMLPINKDSLEWLDVELHSRTRWCLLWSKDAVLARTNAFVPRTVRSATSLTITVTKGDGGMLVEAAFFRAAPELRFDPAQPTLTDSHLDHLTARFAAHKASECERAEDAAARNELHQLYSDLCKMCTPQLQALSSQRYWDRIQTDLRGVKTAIDDDFRGICGDDVRACAERLKKYRDGIARFLAQHRNPQNGNVGASRESTLGSSRTNDSGTAATKQTQQQVPNNGRQAASHDKEAKKDMRYKRL